MNKIFLLIMLASSNAFAQIYVDSLNVQNSAAIGTGNAPAASAILDVVSTTKGALFPRMTTTQRNAISSPATGLIVYDTSLGALYQYNGGWLLSGVQSAAAVSHQWVNSISTAGVPALSQPAFSDISGSATGAQLPNPSSSTLGGVQSVASVSHQWINSISTSGIPALSQPAFSDVSGSVASTQMPALTGDITTSAGTVATTIGAGKVTNAMLAGSIDLTAKVTGALPIANGGTGQATKAAAFDALSPMSASGDVVYGGVSGTGTRLAKGSDGQYLKLVSGLPAWAAGGSGPARVSFGATTSTTAGTTSVPYVFTTKLEDTDSAYNNATGVFTAPTSKGGLYFFFAQVYCGSTAFTAHLYVNGVDKGPGSSIANVSAASGGTWLTILSASDTVDIRPDTNATATGTLINRFYGFKILD